jgi:CheY-like chemotaxis protein
MLPVILLIDDDDAFEFFIGRAMEKARVHAALHYLSSGEQCIQYLTRNGNDQDADESPMPSVMVLDLKMQGISGFRVLEWKRQQPHLRAIPVVVFSSSGLQQDRQFALSLGAAEYCVKPMDMNDLIPFVKILEQYCIEQMKVTGH